MRGPDRSPARTSVKGCCSPWADVPGCYGRRRLSADDQLRRLDETELQADRVLVEEPPLFGDPPADQASAAAALRRHVFAPASGVEMLVVENGGRLAGFASLSPYKERAAYRTTVEDSIYVSRDHPRRGIGRALMEHIIDVARDSGFHTVIARIEASGTASRALHEACGFELVGIEREVGRKFNRWLDVAVMQLIL